MEQGRVSVRDVRCIRVGFIIKPASLLVAGSIRIKHPSPKSSLNCS